MHNQITGGYVQNVMRQMTCITFLMCLMTYESSEVIINCLEKQRFSKLFNNANEPFLV